MKAVIKFASILILFLIQKQGNFLVKIPLFLY